MEKPSDGEIYRKIRQYERLGNLLLVERWKALLSDHRRKCLRLLSSRRDGKLAVAFDDLLDIPGLWDGMRISTLHTVMALNCDEVGLLSVGTVPAHVIHRRLYTISNISKSSGIDSSMETITPFVRWTRLL
jgi:hypothetical protein